jgi:hypothetical protein
MGNETFMNKIERLEVKEPLLHWREILEEWVFMNKKISSATKGKFVPYSYKERTNLDIMVVSNVGCEKRPAILATWVIL